jgi:hypothetical protein
MQKIYWNRIVVFFRGILKKAVFQCGVLMVKRGEMVVNRGFLTVVIQG